MIREWNKSVWSPVVSVFVLFVLIVLGAVLPRKLFSCIDIWFVSVVNVKCITRVFLFLRSIHTCVSMGMEVINRAWEGTPKWTGSSNLSKVAVQNYKKHITYERVKEKRSPELSLVFKEKANKSMNGNEEAKNSRYQNQKGNFVVSLLECTVSGKWSRRKPDKSRRMPLKLKSIKYLIYLVIFRMFLWDSFCVCGGEIQSELGKRRYFEWNVRCQRKGYQNVTRTTSQPPKYLHMQWNFVVPEQCESS